MRGVLILIAVAVGLGLLGGYALSRLNGTSPKVQGGGTHSAAGAAPADKDETCAQLRAQNAGDLYRGMPGYRPELDTNDDGVACSTGDTAA